MTLKTPHHSISIDTFDAHLSGLITAEVHFFNRIDATQFKIPPWIGAEITYDRRFNKHSLATSSIDPRKIPVHPDVNPKHSIVGAIPYFEKKGDIQIVTVTSRKKKRIIFPKGQCESHMDAHEVALMEAKEEAGIEGIITNFHPIMIPYQKETIHNWMLFPMKVERFNEKWEEQRFRKRKITLLSDALKDPKFEQLHPALLYLEMHLAKTTHKGAIAHLRRMFRKMKLSNN